jgi:toxin ParE1/3/4
MHTIIISLPARADINRNYDYLSQINPDSALNFFDSTRQSFAEIARDPEIGRIYLVNNPHLKDLRKWQVRDFRKYLIFYRVWETSIEILRVLQGNQDIDRILTNES